MEHANGRERTPPKKGNDDQLSNIGAHLQQLEENAVEKGEAELVIALAKPFQRLLKYHFLFQDLLFRTDLVTSKYADVLKMFTEIEAILGGIEDKRIQKDERHKVWDILRRIGGLDKVKELAVPKPSRILVEERRIPTGPSHSGVTMVEGRRTFKQPSDILQPGGSNGIGGERDIWLVVFNDVVLRCQRTGTVLLPGWGASWWATNSTPMMGETVEPATAVQLNSGNLYKFLEARFTIHIRLCDLADELLRSRRGMLTSSFGYVEVSV